MTYTIDYAYTSHIGKVRKNNEDNFWCDGHFLPEENNGTEGIVTGTLPGNASCGAAVLDGMGGESCGETASYLGAVSFGGYLQEHPPGRFFFDWERYLRALCLAMNDRVSGYGRENKIESMGSTMVCAFFTRKAVHLANLGDSRIYLMEPSGLRQVSKDHVLRFSSIGKAPLVQYLGMEDTEGMTPDPTIESVRAQDGLQVLLCTDGLTDMVDDRSIEQVLSEETEPEKAVERLLSMALDHGGRDNTTIWLGRIAR